MPERQRAYRRCFQSGYARHDHGGGWPLVLFVFKSAEAEQAFVEIAATLDHAPFVSSHTDVLTWQGVLGESDSSSFYRLVCWIAWVNARLIREPSCLNPNSSIISRLSSSSVRSSVSDWIHRANITSSSGE